MSGQTTEPRLRALFARVPRELHEWFRDYARRHGVDMKAMVIQALEEFQRAHAEQPMKQQAEG